MFLKKKNLITILALALAMAMLLAACGEPRTQPEDDEQPGPDVSRPVVDLPEDSIGSITPDFFYEIKEMYSLSDHTVGWVDVPGTNISNVVVRNPECRNNLYYERRNFYRDEYFYGVYYIDFRADLGPTREYLGVNTTIYGHSIADDPEDERFNIKFGNLHRFRDPEFMRYHPYIFFSLPEENLAFEIIAVFYGNVSNPELFYNDSPGSELSFRDDPNDFIRILEDEVLPRSLWHFDIPFDVNDRFLTLSTCIYYPSCGTTLLGFRDTLYRFGIIARLVDPETPIREYVEFTVNEDRIVDPDGRWQS